MLLEAPVDMLYRWTTVHFYFSGVYFSPHWTGEHIDEGMEMKARWWSFTQRLPAASVAWFSPSSLGALALVPHLAKTLLCRGSPGASGGVQRKATSQRLFWLPSALVASWCFLHSSCFKFTLRSTEQNKLH